MNITFNLIGTKTYKKVKVRIYHNKLNLITDTGLISKIDDWDSQKQQFFSDSISNEKLLSLRNNIEKSFNIDFCSGVIIDKEWMQKLIKKTFFRPTTEEKMHNHAYTIFLVDYAKHWLKNESEDWRNSRSKGMDNKAKSQKSKALQHFINFEKKKGLRVKFVGFSGKIIKQFFDYLIDQKYAVVTAKKTLSDLKFFCLRANEMEIDIHPDFEKEISFPDTKTKFDGIYLNESEITTIFNHDFSDSENMEIIRDNFILSLWTGKRISDLQTIDTSNLIGSNLESIDIKTKSLTKVFLHPQVKATFDKYFGNLPPKIHKDIYNIQIKEICRVCKLDTITYGEVFDKKKKRKIAGYYEKYKLVTSHTARRSFATNMSKIMPVEDVAKLGGWASPKMVHHYNKETASEVAERASLLFQN